MNVLFHTTAAVGVAVLLTDTNKVKIHSNVIRASITGTFAFILGAISHGALDYIPHCYPINSKVDVILGLIIIVIFTFLAKKDYKLIVGLAFIGSIFPDLVDLSPEILNSYLGFNLPIIDNIFPWHWSEYSGSIYVQNCHVSFLNHSLVLLTVGLICWARRNDLTKIFLP